MGNTLCDRLFLNLAEGEEINNRWSAEDQECVGASANLSSEGRSRKLKGIEDKIDSEMIRFYQGSQVTREKDFELESISDMGKMFPQIDPHTAQRWNLEETDAALKELRHLIQDATNNTIIVNEVNYVTHLYLLYQNYLERKRKDEINSKANLIKDTVNLATNLLKTGFEEEKKTGLLNCVVNLTLEALVKTSKDLITTPNYSKLLAFLRKVISLLTAFEPEDRANEKDVSMNQNIEELILNLVKIIQNYKDKVPNVQLNQIFQVVLTLTVYLGRMSIHLQIVEELLTDNLYQKISISLPINLSELKTFSSLVVGGKNPAKESSFDVDTELKEEASTYCVIDHTKVYLCNKKGKAIYNRIPEYGNHAIELSGKTMTHHLFYRKGLVWCSLDSNPRVIMPFPIKHITEESLSEPRIEIPEAVDNLRKDDDTYLKTLEGEWKVTKQLLGSDELGSLTIFTCYTQGEGPKISKIFTLKTLVEDQLKDEKIQMKLVKEVTIIKNGVPIHELDLELESARLNFIGGAVIIYSSNKHVIVIDSRTAEILPINIQIQKAIRGIDTVRNKILHLSNEKGKLSFEPLDIITKYCYQDFTFLNSLVSYSKGIHLQAVTKDLKVTLDEVDDILAAPIESSTLGNTDEHLQSYVTILLKLAFSSSIGLFNLELTTLNENDKKNVLFQQNKIDTRFDTFKSLCNILQITEKLPDSNLKRVLLLAMLKILDIHLNLAARLQGSDKKDIRIINQEYITRLRYLVISLTLPEDIPIYHKSAFDSLKISILTNLFNLTLSIKKLLSAGTILTSLISDAYIYSQAEVSRFLSEVFKLKKKGLADQFDTVIENLLDKLESTITLTIDQERKFFESGFKQYSLVSHQSKTVCANLMSFYNSIIALRGQIKEEHLSRLVKYSVKSIEPGIKSYCKIISSLGSALNFGNVLVDLEMTLLHRFTGYVLFQIISYMSYSLIWPEMVEQLNNMCKDITVSMKVINFTKLEPKISNPDDSMKTFSVDIKRDETNHSKSWIVSLPLYMNVKVEVTGAHPLKDKITINTAHQFDSHNQGKDKKVVDHLFSYYCSVKTDCPINLDTNWIKIILVSEPLMKDQENERKITIKVSGEDLALKKTSKLETLKRLCSHFITQQMLKEIKQLKETGNLMDELSEVAATSLESIFASHLFDNGFQKLIFENISKTYDLKNTMSIESTEREILCLTHYQNLMEVIGFDHQQVTLYDQLCDCLQTDSIKKSLHATIMGKLGLILVKSVFIVLLRHSNKLYQVVSAFKNGNIPSNDPELKKLWLGCTKIRAMSRDYETDRQFEELYKKLNVLMSIEPSIGWDQSQSIGSRHEVESELNEGVFKMKMYIEELRTNNLTPNNKTSNVLVDVLLRFVGHQITADQIIKILDQKEKHLEMYGQATDIVLRLLKENPDNVYDALLMFNQIFRSNPNKAGYLMEDYSGLSKEDVAIRIGKLRELFQMIMNFVCKEKSEGSINPDEIMLAIESLKWMWRGKEIDCIQLIDINRIWSTCHVHLGHNQKFRTSMIDLCFVLLRFCARKTMDLKSDEEEELNLKRNVSVIDESSMTNILNQNFNFLISILNDCMEDFKNIKSCYNVQDYDMLQKYYPKERTFRYLEDWVRDNKEGDPPIIIGADNYQRLNYPSSYETKEITIEETQTYEKPIDIDQNQPVEDEDDSPFGALYEKRETVTEVVKVKKTIEVESESAKKLGTLVSTAEEYSKQNRQKVEQCVEDVSKVLSIFYYYVFSAHEMATLFFQHQGNLKSVVEIAHQSYPQEIRVLAFKILQILSNYLGTEILLANVATLKDTVKLLKPVYENAFTSKLRSELMISEIVKESVLEFIRKLLLNPNHSDKIIAELLPYLDSGNSDSILLVLDILDYSNYGFTPGTLIYDKLDPMKEQMMLLEMTPSLITKAYLRDLLYYKFDITTEEEVSKSRVDRRDLSRNKYLAICLRTKNYCFLDKFQIGRFDPVIEKDMLTMVVDDLKIVHMIDKFSDNESDLIAKFRILKTIRQTGDSKYHEYAQKIFKSIQCTSFQGFSEDDCSTIIHDKIQTACYSFSGKKLIPFSKTAKTLSGRYQDFKCRYYNALYSSRICQFTQSPCSTSDQPKNAYSQFGPTRRPLNANLAFNKPTLNTSLSLDHQGTLSSMLKEGIIITYFKYQYLIRNKENTNILIEEFSKRQALIEMKNNENNEIGDLEVMIEVLLDEEKSKEKVLDLATSLIKRPFDSKDLRWRHKLLGRLVRRAKNLELSKHYVYFLFDEIYRMTKISDEVLRNNYLVNSYVEAMETVVTLSKVLAKDSLILNQERTAMLDYILDRIEIPELGDSYSFKRMHKQEYLINIIIHYLRNIIDRWSIDPKTISNYKVYEWIFDYNKSLMLLTQMDDKNQNLDNLILKALLMKKFYDYDDTDNDDSIFKKYLIEMNENTPFKKLDLSKFSHWFVKKHKDDPYNFCISSDKNGMNPIITCANRGEEMKYDFRMDFRFSIVKTKDYYISYNISDNHAFYGPNEATSHIFSKWYDFTKPMGCTVAVSEKELFIQGKYFREASTNNIGFGLLDHGVYCAASRNNEQLAYYKNKEKQLIQFDLKDQTIMKQFNEPFYQDLRERNENIYNTVDLSEYPLFKRIIFPVNNCCILIDETGGILLSSFGKKPEDNGIDITPLYNYFNPSSENNTSSNVFLKKTHYFKHFSDRVEFVYVHDEAFQEFILVLKTENNNTKIVTVKNKETETMIINDRVPLRCEIMIGEDAIVILLNSGDIFVFDYEKKNILEKFSGIRKEELSTPVYQYCGYLKITNVTDFTVTKDKILAVHKNKEKDQYDLFISEGGDDEREEIKFLKGNLPNKDTVFNPYGNYSNPESTYLFLKNLKRFDYASYAKQHLGRQTDQVVENYPITGYYDRNDSKFKLLEGNKFESVILNSKIEEMEPEEPVEPIEEEEESVSEKSVHSDNEIGSEDMESINKQPSEKQKQTYPFNHVIYPPIPETRDGIVLLFVRPLASEDSMKYEDLENFLRTYDEASFDEESPETWTAALPDKTQYWSVGFDMKSKKRESPPDLENEDLVLVIKVIGRCKVTALEALIEGMFMDAKLVDPQQQTNVLIVPDVIKLNDEEFEILKQDLEDQIIEEAAELKKKYIKYRSLVNDMLSKKIEDEKYNRTAVHQLFSGSKNLDELQEYDETIARVKSEDVDDEKEVISSILEVQKILNYPFVAYSQMIPIFQKRYLDSEFREASAKNLMPTFQKNFRKIMEYENYKDYYINRMKGLKHTNLKRQNFSLLSQLSYEMLSDLNGGGKVSRTILESAELNFLGEAGTDAGGPKREYLGNLCAELVHKLKLFGKSPNEIHNVGEEREKWIPNPKANSKTDLENYYKIGMVMCFASKLRECLELNLPSSFWKYLLDEKLVWEDIKISNLNQWVCLEKIEKMKSEEIEYLEEKFITFLSNGQEFELIPHGRNLLLTQHNMAEYIQMSKNIHLVQLRKAYEMVRRGFRENILDYYFNPITPIELEQETCGLNYVDISVLKKITYYNNFPAGNPLEHQSVIWFWSILNSFTQEELSGYLRYVWGRSRLSHSFGDTHKLTHTSKHKNQIPEAHTCFFELDLGTYASEAELKRLLLYGIQNCTEISETNKKFSFAADFGL